MQKCIFFKKRPCLGEHEDFRPFFANQEMINHLVRNKNFTIFLTSQYGEVLHCNLMDCPADLKLYGAPKQGFAYYKKPRHAEKAIDKLNGQLFLHEI